MPQPKTLSSFADVLPILQAARTAGGAKYQPHHQVTGEPSRGVAIHFKQKVYSFRKLLQEQDAAAHEGISGYVPKSEWDDLHLSFEPGDPTTIVIRFGANAGGSLRGLDGGELRPEALLPKEEPDLTLGEAIELRKKMGL